MEDLIPIATLFGRLLIREVDEELLKELQAPEVSGALSEIGVTVPDDAEALRVEYASNFLVGPEQVPLVQSIWEGGAYQSETIQSLKDLAEETGLEYDRENARAAPLDHLGSILLFWAEVANDSPEARQQLAERHLSWARPALIRLASPEGFYVQVADVVLDLIEQIQQIAD